MEKKNACNILVGNSDLLKSRERHKRRWEGNIKMDLRETGCEVGDWIHLD
jgi:hypothetical protein